MGGWPSRALLRANLKGGPVSVVSVLFRGSLAQKTTPQLLDIPPRILIPSGLTTFQEALIKTKILV